MQPYLESLTTTALLGTDKRELPDADAQMSALIADGAPEKTLLTQLAAADLYVRGAQQALADARLHVEPAPDEEVPVISGEAAYYLRQMYNGKEKEFLSEFLTAVADAGKRIPHADLPELLEIGRRNSTLRESIDLALTARGYWLARQNPQWGYAIRKTDVKEDFETGELPARTAALRTLRQTDADSARELLAQGWGKEVAKARDELLETFKVNLSSADEAFLDSALADKSKNVRYVAAELLAKLPDSAYTQRMIARAQPLIEFEHGGLLKLKRAKLRVTLPDALDESALQDGLGAQDPPRGVGKKAWAFKQIVSRVPLHVWTANADLHTLLKACPKDDRALLLDSWVAACMRFPQMDYAAEYAAELIDYELTTDTITRLAKNLTNEQAILLAAKILNQEPVLVSGHPFIYLLGRTKFEWPDRLQKQFQHSLTNSAKKWKQNREGKAVLESLIRVLPVEILPLATQAMPQNADLPVFNAVADFQRLAEFRQKMIVAVRDS